MAGQLYCPICAVKTMRSRVAITMVDGQGKVRVRRAFILDQFFNSSLLYLALMICAMPGWSQSRMESPEATLPRYTVYKSVAFSEYESHQLYEMLL